MRWEKNTLVGISHPRLKDDVPVGQLVLDMQMKLHQQDERISHGKIVDPDRNHDAEFPSHQNTNPATMISPFADTTLFGDIVNEILGDTPLGGPNPFTDADRETLLAQRAVPQQTKPRNRHVISLVWLLLVLDIIVLNIGIGFLNAGGRVVSVFIFCLIPFNLFLRIVGGFSAYLPRRLNLSRYVVTLQPISTFLCFSLIFVTFTVSDVNGMDSTPSPTKGLRVIGFSTFSMYFIVSLAYAYLAHALRTTYLQLEGQLQRLQRVGREVAEGEPRVEDRDVELDEPEPARVLEIPRNAPQPQPSVAARPPQPRSRNSDAPEAQSNLSVDGLDEIGALAAASIAAERMNRSAMSSWAMSPSASVVASAGRDSSPSISLSNSKYDAPAAAQDAPLTSSSTSSSSLSLASSGSDSTPIFADYIQSDEASQAIFGALERQFPVGSTSLLEEPLD